MAMATTVGALPEAEHSAQLRKAVIASTVGTAIEWYDFFLYGTAAGLVFGKLYFPHESALAGTLAAFGTYFIGFVGRPIGAAIFGHYGDRIGRKATLIATLLCMGLATFAIAFVPTYEFDRHLGRGALDRAAGDPGHRRRRRMGRLGAAGYGMVAHARSARPGRLLAAIRRSLRAPALDARRHGLQQMGGRRFRDLGLAHTVRAVDHPGRNRPVDPSWHPRDSGVPESSSTPTRSRRRRSSR